MGTEDISKENMGRYGMREVRGVGVTQVVKDSPAEKAGLKKDDVILRFDGESVTSARKLSRLVSESSPDQTVRLTISRGGAEQEVSATLSKHSMKNLLGAAIRDDVLKGIEKDWPQIQVGRRKLCFLVWRKPAHRCQHPTVNQTTRGLFWGQGRRLADHFSKREQSRSQSRIKSRRHNYGS